MQALPKFCRNVTVTGHCGRHRKGGFRVVAVTPARERHQCWRLDSLDWGAVRPPGGGEGERLFYTLAAASFMESTTDRYTGNLVDKFRDDREIADWLREHWLPEELQHGEALRRYVNVAWPDFDWERAYAAFIDEFTPYCAGERLEPTLSREMASRCVVEMGTASFYTALSRAADEPVLTRLTALIAEDEIRHYKHFYRYFRRYREREEPGRGAVAVALWHRLRMIAGEDNAVALKHVYIARHPGRAFDRRTYRMVSRGPRIMLRQNFPHRMCVQMLLRPLGLGRRTQHYAVPVMAAMARRLVP